MAALAPEVFVREILGQLDLRGIVCGFDFHYGAMGAGNCETLKEQADFEVSVIEAVSDEKGKISSTRISEEIEKGNLEEVSRMLGYEYQLEGLVIHGRHKGTGMGFPTANIRYSAEYILPPAGVYAGYARIGTKKVRAMINLGHNPTLNYSENLSLEAHLIGWTGDLYGRMITLHLVKRLRNEKRFKNRSNLIMQLDQDLRDTRKLLNAYERSLSEADERAPQ
jgi:riboflavin kinase/FMN adenylyltransferase